MIKKTLFLTMAILCMQQLHAQTEKGNFLIGVDSGLSFFNQNRDGAEDINIFNFFGNGAYFVADNLALGFGLGYGWSNTESVSTQRISVIPLARYYVGQFFVGARYSYVRSRIEIDTSNEVRTSDEWDVGLQAGYAFFFNDHIALEPTLNYQFIDGGDRNIQTLSLRAAFTIYLP